MAEDWGRVRLEFPDKPENCAAHAKYWFLRMRTAASTWHHVISYVEFVVNFGGSYAIKNVIKLYQTEKAGNYYL